MVDHHQHILEVVQDAKTRLRALVLGAAAAIDGKAVVVAIVKIRRNQPPQCFKPIGCRQRLGDRTDTDLVLVLRHSDYDTLSEGVG